MNVAILLMTSALAVGADAPAAPAAPAAPVVAGCSSCGTAAPSCCDPCAPRSWPLIDCLRSKLSRPFFHFNNGCNSCAPACNTWAPAPACHTCAPAPACNTCAPAPACNSCAPACDPCAHQHRHVFQLWNRHANACGSCDPCANNWRPNLLVRVRALFHHDCCETNHCCPSTVSGCALPPVPGAAAPATPAEAPKEMPKPAEKVSQAPAPISTVSVPSVMVPGKAGF